MSDALLGKVRERAKGHLEAHADSQRNAVEAVLADVETALVLARREGFCAGMGVMASPDVLGSEPYVQQRSASLTYPLPTRTRQVLREEPVPGTGHPLFRVHDGVLQVLDGSYRECYPTGRQFDLMAHALDLHANPYRTEEVPGDESDPWGEKVSRPRARGQYR